jgi:hypothetical protein
MASHWNFCFISVAAYDVQSNKSSAKPNIVLDAVRAQSPELPEPGPKRNKLQGHPRARGGCNHPKIVEHAPPEA